MTKGAPPTIIDAQYKIVKKAKAANAGRHSAPLRALLKVPLSSWPRLTVLIAAINASLFVRLLMKHLLDWG